MRPVEPPLLAPIGVKIRKYYKIQTKRHERVFVEMSRPTKKYRICMPDESGKKMSIRRRRCVQLITVSVTN